MLIISDGVDVINGDCGDAPWGYNPVACSYCCTTKRITCMGEARRSFSVLSTLAASHAGADGHERLVSLALSALARVCGAATPLTVQVDVQVVYLLGLMTYTLLVHVSLIFHIF